MVRNVLFLLALVACWVIPYSIYHASLSAPVALTDNSVCEPPKVEIPDTPYYERHTPDMDHLYPPVRADTPNNSYFWKHLLPDSGDHWHPPIRDKPGA